VTLTLTMTLLTQCSRHHGRQRCRGEQRQGQSFDDATWPLSKSVCQVFVHSLDVWEMIKTPHKKTTEASPSGGLTLAFCLSSPILSTYIAALLASTYLQGQKPAEPGPGEGLGGAQAWHPLPPTLFLPHPLT
jgi:hypothetical protein